MDNTTVFTKTAKGITQVNQRSASLSRDLMKVLKLVDGKSTFAEILEKGEYEKPSLEKAISTLIRDGYARVSPTPPWGSVTRPVPPPTSMNSIARPTTTSSPRSCGAVRQDKMSAFVKLRNARANRTTA